MLLTIFIGLLCICLIVTAAYSAQVKYNINGIIAECEEVRGEIQNLNAAIKGATNIKIIEEHAINQLGMVYPSMEQIKYISKGNKTQDFALTLKQIAYIK
jgi:cell division protein FtsL